MKPNKAYRKMKQSCRYCGRKRDGKPGLLCAKHRTELNSEHQRRYRKRQADKKERER